MKMSSKNMLVLLVLLVMMVSTSLSAKAPKGHTKLIPPTLQEQQQTPHLDGYRPKPPYKKRPPSNKPPQLDGYRPKPPYNRPPSNKPPQLDALVHYEPNDPSPFKPKPPQLGYRTKQPYKPKPPQLDNYKPPHDEEQHNTDNYIPKRPPHDPPNVETTKEMPLKEQLDTHSHPKTNPGHGGATQPNSYHPKQPPRNMPPSAN